MNTTTKKAFYTGKTVDVAALKAELTEKVRGVDFSDKRELRDFIGEIVCDTVEVPLYEDSDFSWDDGHTFYDLCDNVDDLRDMENDLVREVAEELGLI